MKANGVTHTANTTTPNDETNVIGDEQVVLPNGKDGTTAAKQQRHGRAYKLKQLFRSKQHNLNRHSGNDGSKSDLSKNPNVNNENSRDIDNDECKGATLSPSRFAVTKRRNKHRHSAAAADRCSSEQLSASAPVTPIKCLHVPVLQQQLLKQQVSNHADNISTAREQRKNRSRAALSNFFTLPTWMPFSNSNMSDKAGSKTVNDGPVIKLLTEQSQQQHQQQQKSCDTTTNGTREISISARDGAGSSGSSKPSVRFAPECRLPSDSSQSSDQPSLTAVLGSDANINTDANVCNSNCNGNSSNDIIGHNERRECSSSSKAAGQNVNNNSVAAKEMINKEVQTERPVDLLENGAGEQHTRGLNRRSASCRMPCVALKTLSQRFGTEIGHTVNANNGVTTTANDSNNCAANSDGKIGGSRDQATIINGSTDAKQPGECPMNTDKFRLYGRQLIDYIGDFADTIGKRRVTPLNIEPGYLRSLLPVAAPLDGEPFPEIMQDFEKHIMRGITHWQHPRFHAYFPAGNAYPSILADMLSDAIGCVGFSWAASPACTELEIIMLDWMGKMIGLPDEFLCLSRADSKGGGVIQGSASECVLVNMLAARYAAIERLRKKYPNTPDGTLLTKLIGYCSKESHSCVEKAAMISFIKMRALETDDKYALRGDTLAKGIKADLANGLEPFLVSATLGTTSCCSFDNLEEVGRVCHEHNLWLHVDAAYAGSALICPEFKYLMRGIEFASSFNMNPNKWMLINFDCSLMWVKDRFQLTRAFVVDPLYLQHSFSDQAIDYRHWGIPLSRRFRSLKLWFVIRNYGVSGLQNYIRNHVKLAKQFEQLLLADKRFEIINQVVLGLVCFRLIGSNALNQRLLSNINASGKLHMVPASLNGRYIIRFCVCAQDASEKDIIYSFQCIAQFATELFESIEAGRERIRAISQQNTIDVSDVSLHTQQSVASEAGSSTLPTLAPSERSLSRQMSSPGVAVLDQQRPSSSLVASMRSVTNSAVSPNGVDGATIEQQQADRANIHDIDDDLEEEIILDSLVPEEDEEDELDDEEEEDVEDDHEDAHEKRAVSSSNNSKNGNDKAAQHDDEAEARDEVFTLNKRNRMSLRYKRGFFVRVVSDPKMYRVSISGDIGDSSGSIGSTN
ncbi:Tyrosine decarboxylase [Fragariocoptes setiger]|uniref:Tyrosine decarboxylase n=1 Tax=Fragariocoptes setiger TaxID=1670756 RepID=A0ABQ7SAI3_9ACAR|nr:Tyrosine decarboxylase [Fragariocoptes setiger]